ncbi:MAG: LuxR family transcriptional regulator [Burkholderiales bacterium RIFCSPHIGHO2_12_FULL_61_11]|nr:MAG: LuxR family transcriptional regulator [Burkholderiales bacterium RIFCSPHIGHO2_12_FULL_61_11]
MRTIPNVGFFFDGLARPLGQTNPDSSPDLLALLVDELAYGVLVIGAQGQIYHANRAASRELQLGDLLTNRLGDLEISSPADDQAFQAALGEALVGKRSLIQLSANDRSIAMAVIPLKRQGGVLDDRVALFLSRAGVCESGMLAGFSRQYGLTPTEQHVLVYLCRCLSTPEIAVQMKVAVSTVRTHVRSLCAKTNSYGVRELIRQVAILPPIDTPSLGAIH